MGRVSAGALLLGLVSVVVAVVCAPAAARIYTSSSEQQLVPGLTQRTIWSEDQVAVYRLPKNVTHVGDIHVELTYKPANRDCYICLLDQTGAVVPGTYEQGRLGLWPGKEVIDYAVSAVTNAGWNQPDASDVQGDAYYVLVQSVNGVSSYRLSGYFPRTVAGSDDTTSPSTFTRATLQFPAKATAWAKIAGAPYGGPWDFTPTSQGTVYARLEYPANVRAHTVNPTSTAMPASFEQYVYPALWQAVHGSLPVSEPSDMSHWDLWDLNHHDSRAPVAGGAWYGLEGTFTAQKGGTWQPNAVYHYVPALWMVASNSAAGPAAPPRLGTVTLGYKATLLIPQNLRLASASKAVRRGRMAIFKGTLALPAGPSPAAQVSWAAPGTKLQIQRQSGRKWRLVKTVVTGRNGAWTGKLPVKTTAVYRAFWPGSGALAAEASLTRTVTVRR